MTFRKLTLTTMMAVVPVLLSGQNQLDWGSREPKPVPGPAATTGSPAGGLDPSTLTKPLADSWATYSGDYTGRRYSALKEINAGNVKGLTLAWVARLNPGSANAGAGGGGFGGGGFGGRGGGPAAPTNVGGEGTGEFGGGGGASVKGAILQVDGVLYVTAPDNVWAMDARDGRLLWQYFWKTKGGTHIGNRGAALWHNYLFFETPDNYLVSLDAKTGKERWHVEISDFNQQYFSTMAPIVVGDQVLVGTGNDLDAPGFLQSYDPVTGTRKWIFYTVPMKPGDPGLDTWPNLESARHGGGQVWIPGVYDPETKLYIFGTGNPTPGYTGVGRKGDNLFTCALVAVNVDTGKMAWYYQTSPHDTHDWDSAQTPVMIDATIDGKPRKLVSTASRNGYFFTVDRTNGEPVVTEKYGLATNWVKGETAEGQSDSRSRQGSHHPGIARVAGRRWRDELAAAGVLAGYRPVLRQREQRLQHPLPDGPRSTRVDGAGRQGCRRRRLGGVVPDGDRSQDRQGRVALSVSGGQRWRRIGWSADHRRWSALRRRRRRKLRRA